MYKKKVMVFLCVFILLGSLGFSQTASHVRVEKILVSPSSGEATLGELVNFQIIVTNISKKKITSLTISDTYDMIYLDYISAEPEPDFVSEGQGFLGFNNFIQRFGELMPGESHVISVTFEAIALPAAAPMASNTVTVSGYDEDTIPFSHPSVTAEVNIVQKCAFDPYEPNESQKQAPIINLCEPVRAYICPWQDVDFFSVSLKKAGYYHFKLYHLPENYDLYLYEPGGLKPVESSTNLGAASESIILQSQGSTGIYIEVRALQAFSYNVPYLLHVSYLGVSGPDLDVVEPGSQMPVFGEGLPAGSPKQPAMASFYMDKVSQDSFLGSSPVLPGGKLASSVYIPSSLSGRHTLLTNVAVGDQMLAEIRRDFDFMLRPIIMDCWVDDAWLYTPYGKKPIVNKLVPQQYTLFGKTVVDIVCDLYNQVYEDSSVFVQILVEDNKFGSPGHAYVRNSHGGTLTEIPFESDGGGQYHVNLTGLATGDARQVVFRFRIPHSLTTPSIVDITAACYDPDWEPVISVAVPRKIRLLSGVHYMIFTTRTTLFRDHSESEVADLLGQVFLHSQDNAKFATRDKRAVVYYVDHYRTEEEIIDWDNTAVDYSSEHNANRTARYIQWLMWDRFYDSQTLNPYHFLIIGNDEQFPMYRMLDPYNREWKWANGFPGGHKGNPALRCCFENYYFTDNFYAYIPGGYIPGGWRYGNVDLRIGRIIGHTAEDMAQLYLRGLTETGSTGRAVMASVDGWELGYEPDDGRAGEDPDFINVPARLASKGLSVKNDTESPRTIDVMSYPTNWATGFQSAANGGMDLFFIGGHNSYWYADLPYDNFDPSDIPGKYNRFDDDNPIVMIVGCHGGLPVPNVGWSGGASDSMVYNMIRNGARAYFGASGYSYGSPDDLHKCRWGELYLQYLFYHFIRGTSSSYYLGTGIRNAKINYPFGIGGKTSLDKKTLTEFNLFGIPWQKLDYPGSGGGSKSQRLAKEKMPLFLAREKNLMLSPRKVLKLAEATYKQQFDIDTASWKPRDLKKFQVIDIPDGVQQYIPDAPLLPAVTSYSIALPPDGEILSISVDEYTTKKIGIFNIPTILVEAWTEGGITLGEDTDIDYFYPPEIVYSHEGMPSHYLFSAFPVRHNPTTNDTVFHEHLRVTVKYKAPVPFGILHFQPDASVFPSTRKPGFTAEIFNMGDSELDLSGLLSIVDTDTLTTLTETGMNLHLLPGTVYPLICSAGLPLPEGEYQARLRVSHKNGDVVTAETAFSVDSAFLSNLDAEYLFTKKEVSFTVDATNLTDDKGDLSLAFNILNDKDIPVDTVYASPATIDPDSTVLISDTWIPDKGITGSFSVEAVGTFGEGALNSLKTDFTVFSHQSLLDALLNHLLRKKALPLADQEVADFNKDFQLDISDVVAIIQEMP